MIEPTFDLHLSLITLAPALLQEPQLYSQLASFRSSLSPSHLAVVNKLT
jgi:hypothetical protein